MAARNGGEATAVDLLFRQIYRHEPLLLKLGVERGALGGRECADVAWPSDPDAIRPAVEWT